MLADERESTQMPNISRWIVTSLLAMGALWPGLAAAQTEPEQPSGPLLSIEQVRAAYGAAGYSVDRAYVWDWTRPPVTSFQVHGQSDGRVLMVLVYASNTAADSARLQAESHEQALKAGQPGVVGTGPHMVLGYGPSLWRANVALVESTDSQLMRVYEARGTGMPGDKVFLEDPTMPNIAVDLDFLEALQQSGAVNV
jgi:hypothetical protein